MNTESETTAASHKDFAHHYGAKHPQQQQAGLGLMIGAIGVVFGDIGTSPLYTLREAFVHTGEAVTPVAVFGFLSMIFWLMTLIVSLKYASFLLQANNRGEGGIMALASLALAGGRRTVQLRSFIILISIIGISLFFADSLVTPAISVLSAVEGLKVISEDFTPLVLPLAVGILLGLFMLQRHGTRFIGKLAGPVCVVWFTTLGALGLWQVIEHPAVLQAINPLYAFHYIIANPGLAFVAAGSLLLAITGAEALFADLGHYGPRPIKRAWFLLVFPGLILNYFGQGALLLQNPAALENPFFKLVPEGWVLPLVVLASAATIIASQAVITAAFSLTAQAVQLGFLPRMLIKHTDAHIRGQIYIPVVNWVLMIGVLLLVLGMQTSSNLAAMYGVAVMGTMLCASLLFVVVMRRVWRRSWLVTLATAGVFLLLDLTLFSATLLKIHDGGYISLLVGFALLVLIYTWKQGRETLLAKRRVESLPVADFVARVAAEKPWRVPGTAVYLAATAETVPYPLLYNYKHNKVLHERVVLLTIRNEERPKVDDAARVIVGAEANGIWHVVLRYGFMEQPRVLHALSEARKAGLEININDTSFFLGRDRLVASHRPSMPRWQQGIFFWLAHTALSATDYFKLPRHRVVELGAQIEL